MKLTHSPDFLGLRDTEQEKPSMFLLSDIYEKRNAVGL